MYTPPHNRQADPEELFAFMREFSFATLVTWSDAGLTATHLPLLVRRVGTGFRITGHLAKANSQAADLEAGREALAIFAAPHAYISPSLYEPGNWVPTWNYVAVHASGRPIVGESRDAKLAILREAIASYEPGYQQGFDLFPPEFVDARLTGIVAFEIEVSKLEGRWKLSQERKASERERIHAALAGSDDALAARLSAYMQPAAVGTAR
jgi:transcriptional regulator